MSRKYINKIKENYCKKYYYSKILKKIYASFEFYIIFINNLKENLFLVGNKIHNSF